MPDADICFLKKVRDQVIDPIIRNALQPHPFPAGSTAFDLLQYVAKQWFVFRLNRNVTVPAQADVARPARGWMILPEVGEQELAPARHGPRITKHILEMDFGATKRLLNHVIVNREALGPRVS